MPIAVTMMMMPMIMGSRTGEGSCEAIAHQSSTAARDPHVPGPGRSRPAPKKVATSVAHLGAVVVVEATSVGLFDMAVRIAGIVRLRIVQRSRDHISAARPFTEIDRAATFAAEWEFLIAGDYQLLAGGTPQAATALLLHHY